MFMAELLGSAIEWARTAQSELIQDHIKGLVHEQSSRVDLTFFESVDFFDKMERARNEAGSRSLALLENSGELVQSAITLIAMAALLTSYGAWLPLVLFIGTLPAFVVIIHADRRYHEWWERRTYDRRLTHYYDLLLTDSHAAAEIRMFDLSPHFGNGFQQTRKILRHERLNLLRRQNIEKLGANALAFLVGALTMAWMLWGIFNGIRTLGDLALFYQAFQRGQGLMRSLLGSAGQIITNSLFVSNLFTFLDLEPEVVDPPLPQIPPMVLRFGIGFNDISFSYPGSQRAALKDFNLFVSAGEIAAIVGANGAGKTTVLKLLCRFFDPQKGNIEIDGIDIRQFTKAELRRMITILFQQPLRFFATASQNIAFGDISASPTMEEIQRAAQAAGADEAITRLANGYDSMLGRAFGGVELSGGEYQRVALARAYLRRSPLILLDEPTSFIDSWGEADWYRRFKDLAQGRTGILVTHRFTIAMRADIIHVMDGGKIVESGSHHQLLAKGGLYAQSWKAQMRAAGETPSDSDIDDRVLESVRF
jgi:ATP-binding cassette subfamily B protein